MKIWTCGVSPQSGPRNARTRIKTVNGANHVSDFYIFSARSKYFPVGRDWWPWTKPGYITMNRRQNNNQWSGGIASHRAPIISECKNTLENFSLRFLGSRRHPTHWLSSKRPNYQRGVLLIFAGSIEGHFGGKTPREVHQGGLVLVRQCPGSPDTGNPEETGLPGLPVSYRPPCSPDLAPSDYHLFPGLKITMESWPFFFRRGSHFCRGDPVGWKNLGFFLLACKT